jgi:MFS family permease
MIIEYLLLIIVLFLLNAQPVLNMPTWIILSFFTINYGLPVMEITIIGVITASLGRCVLAVYTGKLTDKYLPKKQRKNIQYIAGFIGNKTNPIELFVLSFLYGLSPLPTNTLFMVAGAAHVRLPFIVGGFFFGEFLSNFIYVSAITVTLTVGHFFLMGLLGVAIAIAIMFIDWKKIIEWLIEREGKKLAR